MRIAVLGDVAGHADQLRAELDRLGVRDGRLPDDLVVIQVGDLIHRGPDSEAVIELVDHHLERSGRRWVQLIGNHEAQYVHQPVFAWPQKLSRRSAKTLRRWVARGDARVAAAISTPTREYLVTHAGLTEPFWRRILGGPTTAADAASALNGLLRGRDASVFAAGVLLNRSSPIVGPLWAQTATELVPGWLATRVPFSQIYGHSTITDWADPVAPPPTLAGRLVVDHVFKHERIAVGDQELVGIDPGHGSHPVLPWRAFEVTGTVS
ncbi:MAG: metallophosphoesterase [Gordonia sp. (in: high G+C Gram-positive bacteria)]|uniref:metallophosphoesterase n=1 Tax=Gordonia sp. (in: high G+C Gram-positive bacteria) TaxID=84139 RepID=UPI0039E383A6